MIRIHKTRPIAVEKHKLYLFLFSVLFFPSLIQAQTQREEWKFKIAPYLMGAAMEGTTVVRGRETNVDLSAGDIFSNLKFGFMGYFEARKGSWGFGSDTVYMALGTFTEIPSANVDVNQLAWTFLGIRELNPWAELVFGTRWNRIEGTLDFKRLDIQVGDTRNWVDPVVGLRLSTDKTRRFHAGLLADIGGFGLASDFAWEVFPTAGVNIGKGATLAFGYRWLDMDYKTGEGNELFRYNVLSHGPTVGFSFGF